jgi:hypothetical protein
MAGASSGSRRSQRSTTSREAASNFAAHTVYGGLSGNCPSYWASPGIASVNWANGCPVQLLLWYYSCAFIRRPLPAKNVSWYHTTDLSHHYTLNERNLRHRI